MWSDEIRLGLILQGCRVWGPRGVAVSQAVQINRQYTYVAVAIDPMTGRLWWAWQQNMKGEEMARIRGGEPGPKSRRSTAGSGMRPAVTRARTCRPSRRPRVVQSPYTRSRTWSSVSSGSCTGSLRAASIRPCRPSRGPWNQS